MLSTVHDLYPLSKGFISGLRPENCSATSCFLFQLFLSFNNYSLVVLCDKIFSVLKHSPSGLLTIKDPDLPAHSRKLKIEALPQKCFNTYHIGRELPPAQPFCNISIWAGVGVSRADACWNNSLLKYQSTGHMRRMFLTAVISFR